MGGQVVECGHDADNRNHDEDGAEWCLACSEILIGNAFVLGREAALAGRPGWDVAGAELGRPYAGGDSLPLMAALGIPADHGSVWCGELCVSYQEGYETGSREAREMPSVHGAGE